MNAQRSTVKLATTQLDAITSLNTAESTGKKSIYSVYEQKNNISRKLTDRERERGGEK